MGSTTVVRSEIRGNGAATASVDAEAVREQLGRILASPLFKNSKHYPALLRYVVEHTLEGHTAPLKERALGVEVFGRDPHYDTNLDPVVRTSACEVRKRIAQYYHEPGHETEVRIDLPSGSYVPEFRPPEARPQPAPVEPLTVVEPEPQAKMWNWQRFAAIAAGLAALGGTAVGIGGSRSAVQRFWAPVWGAADLVTVCVSAPGAPGQQVLPAAQPDPGPGPSYLDVMRGDRMAYADALTMSRLTALFSENGKRFEIRRGTASTLADFRKGPAVLIGAYNNDWTMRLENHLRFTFERDGTPHGGYIRDRQNPSKIEWRYDPEKPYAQVTEDYAIVSRFVDPRTEKMVVVVAGMGKDGTLAAGEFVTVERYLRGLSSRAPAGWERKNLQAVIATEIIKGNAGPPKVLAVHAW